MKRNIIYLLLFIFCTWLALATRSHRDWFWPFVAEYGGDTIWAAMFLFLLRILSSKIKMWKLAILNFVLGVLIEVSQLYRAGWINDIRHTYAGRLLLGQGFLWSDIICYAAGTVISLAIIVLVEKFIPA